MVDETVVENDRINEKAGHQKEGRNEHRVCKEPQLLFRRFVLSSRVYGKSDEEGTHDTRKLNQTGQTCGHDQHSEHQNKVNVFLVSRLVQSVPGNTAQNEQNEKDE